MSNKYNLKTVTAALSGTDVVNVLDAVPDGKTRFICMVKLALKDNGLDINGVSIINGELDTSDVTVVDHTHFDGAVGDINMTFPAAVDVENPFFSIAEKRFLNIQGVHLTGTGTVTFVYFDD